MTVLCIAVSAYNYGGVYVVLLAVTSSSVRHTELSPVPQSDRSGSVTPTNEPLVEESLTPRSVSTTPYIMLYTVCVCVCVCV